MAGLLMMCIHQMPSKKLQLDEHCDILDYYLEIAAKKMSRESMAKHSEKIIKIIKMTRTRLTLLLLIGINLLLNSGCEKVVEKSVVEVKVVEENVVEIKIIEEKLVEESSLNFRNDKYYPVNSNTPYTGKIVTYYKNGQFEENRSYKDGKLDGVSKWYYENGQLEYSKNYKDGKLDGVFEEYDENGQLKESGSFKDGEKVGL